MEREREREREREKRNAKRERRFEGSKFRGDVIQFAGHHLSAKGERECRSFIGRWVRAYARREREKPGPIDL